MLFPSPRVPVWLWRSLMAIVAPGEARRFNAHPITTVDYTLDVDYAGDGLAEHRLDVIAPKGERSRLPVYLYFHGGGWTSGDKAPLTKYCGSLAKHGIVVVNVNYRKVAHQWLPRRRSTGLHMADILADATAALSWLRSNVRDYGGDPDNIVIGGDSAGGQIAALLASSTLEPRLREHFNLEGSTPSGIRGVVQHCGITDLSVLFDRGFVMSLDFVRMLVPNRPKGLALRRSAHFLSPVEWLRPGFPPVLVTTSERDYFYGANLNFIERLRSHGIPVDALVYGRKSRRARHTWQQDARHPESQEVYRRVREFVTFVTGAAVAA